MVEPQETKTCVKSSELYFLPRYKLLTNPAAAQDFSTGVFAWVTGDYAAALREFQPLADQGHAEAQSKLGLMYLLGLGVPKDYTQTVKCWRQAAEQDYAPAQYDLGYVYHGGVYKL